MKHLISLAVNSCFAVKGNINAQTVPIPYVVAHEVKNVGMEVEEALLLIYDNILITLIKNFVVQFVSRLTIHCVGCKVQFRN
jgi:hypothetical protein